jgi:hypothetical protein
MQLNMESNRRVGETTVHANHKPAGGGTWTGAVSKYMGDVETIVLMMVMMIVMISNRQQQKK